MQNNFLSDLILFTSKSLFWVKYLVNWVEDDRNLHNLDKTQAWKLNS